MLHTCELVMPSPLGFLWAGIVEEIGGRWSITSVKHWLSACIVVITLAIWALKSVVRLLERSVIFAIILVQSVVTLMLINLDKSSLMSAAIWSWSALVVMAFVMVVWVVLPVSGSFCSPF